MEWNQKLWWVHAEAPVCMLKGYRCTGNRQRLEWFGYLNRQGETLLRLKGGKWEGCFHVPRALYLCRQLPEKC